MSVKLLSEDELSLADAVRSVPLRYLPARDRMKIIRMIMLIGEMRGRADAVMSLCVGCGVDGLFECECDQCQIANAVRAILSEENGEQ